MNFDFECFACHKSASEPNGLSACIQLLVLVRGAMIPAQCTRTTTKSFLVPIQQLISLGKSQLGEENLVAHLGVAEKFRPADYFHIELDIRKPLEPP